MLKPPHGTGAQHLACAGCAQEAESKSHMLASVWNWLDFLACFPPLVELIILHGTSLPFRLGRIDLRWFKLLRRGFYDIFWPDIACSRVDGGTIQPAAKGAVKKGNGESLVRPSHGMIRDHGWGA